MLFSEVPLSRRAEMTFRGFLMWVHLVLGLTGAVIIAILAVTGAYITFQVPLQRWLNPVPAIVEFTGAADFDRIVQEVEGRFPSRYVASINVRRHEATVVRLRDRTTVFVDPHTTKVISSRPYRFSSLENLTLFMRRLHTELLLGRKGRLLVTIATAETLLLALTGLWLWWRKKHWQFRAWRGSVFRVSWDLHNATGLWFLIPVLSMVVTGLLLAIPKPVHRLAGALPAPWPGPPASTKDSIGAGVTTLSRALVAADSALPGELTVRVTIPAGPAASYAVSKSGRTVYVDQYSGGVIEVRPDRAPTAGDEAIESVEHLHTGESLGIPGRTIMTLGSLMLAVMTLTGVVLGWKRLLILFNRRVDVADRG
jgi:uncharacterized iron-regulated membrane protein